MRVLLVEDDPATAQGIEMMLRSESYVCDVTDMGEDGLDPPWTAAASGDN